MIDISRFIRWGVGSVTNALGIVVCMNAGIGMAPWYLLIQGVSLTFLIRFGQAIVVVSLLAIALSMFLREVPGVSSVLRMSIVAVLVELFLSIGFIMPASEWFNSFIYILLSVSIIALSEIILEFDSSREGPFDTLISLLECKTQLTYRGAMYLANILAIVLGIILKGQFGFGTILMFLLLAPVKRGIIRSSSIDKNNI